MLWKKFFNKNIPTHWPLDHYQCPITGFKTGSCGFGCDCLPSVPQPMIPLNILYRRIWITVWGQVLLFIKCKKWCSSCVTAFHIPMLHGLAGPVVHLLLLRASVDDWLIKRSQPFSISTEQSSSLSAEFLMPTIRIKSFRVYRPRGEIGKKLKHLDLGIELERFVMELFSGRRWANGSAQNWNKHELLPRMRGISFWGLSSVWPVKSRQMSIKVAQK